MRYRQLGIGVRWALFYYQVESNLRLPDFGFSFHPKCRLSTSPQQSLMMLPYSVPFLARLHYWHQPSSKLLTPIYCHITAQDNGRVDFACLSANSSLTAISKTIFQPHPYPVIIYSSLVAAYARLDRQHLRKSPRSLKTETISCDNSILQSSTDIESKPDPEALCASLKLGLCDSEQMASKNHSQALCKRCRNMCTSKWLREALDDNHWPEARKYNHYTWQEYETHACLGCPVCQLVLDNVPASRRGSGRTYWWASLSRRSSIDDSVSVDDEIIGDSRKVLDGLNLYDRDRRGTVLSLLTCARPGKQSQYYC